MISFNALCDLKLLPLKLRPESSLSHFASDLSWISTHCFHARDYEKVRISCLIGGAVHRDETCQ
jgi:hypothetical protein